MLGMIAMAGAGVPGGQVVGATDREGGQAVDKGALLISLANI